MATGWSATTHTNVQEAESDSVRKGTVDWWDVVMSTRVNDPRSAAKVVVMQRCHQQDLSGHVLEQGGWEHLCLPAEYEGPGRVTSIGFSDPRTEIGELLWPERFGPEELETLKRSLGTYAAAGQLQQRPSPSGGGIFQRHWFRLWQPPGANLPPSWSVSPTALNRRSLPLKSALSRNRFSPGIARLRIWHFDLAVGCIHTQQSSGVASRSG